MLGTRVWTPRASRGERSEMGTGGGIRAKAGWPTQDSPRPGHRAPSHTWPVFSSTGRTGPRPPGRRKDRVPIRLGTNETDLEEAPHSEDADERALGLVGTVCANRCPEPVRPVQL